MRQEEEHRGLLAVQDILAAGNARRVASGESPDDVYPEAVAATEHVFRFLEQGLGTCRAARPHRRRSGERTAYDRVLATRFGWHAVEPARDIPTPPGRRAM